LINLVYTGKESEIKKSSPDIHSMNTNTYIGLLTRKSSCNR